MRYARTALGKRIWLWVFFTVNLTAFAIMPLTALHLMREESVKAVASYREDKPHIAASRLLAFAEMTKKTLGIPLAVTSVLGLALAFHAARKASRPVDDIQDEVRDLIHDLRAPIAGMKSNIEFSLEGMKDPEAALASMLEQSETVLEIYDENSEIVRNYAGVVGKDEASEFSLRDVIVEVERVFRDLAENAGLTFNCCLPSDAVMVRSYRKKLRSLVSNLLDNAVKYTNEGHVSISLRKRLTGITLVVEDTGIGMSDRELELIGTTYCRVSSSEGKPGIGRGIALAQSIVSLCHGKMKIRSAPGKGSTFTVTLPFDMAPGKSLCRRTALRLGSFLRNWGGG